MNAEPLVLLPGMMSDARLFMHQLAHFSVRRPVHVAPMTLGATIELMAESVLAGAPNSFALAGHGLGGAVAMEVQRRAPGRVSRLALLSSNAQSEMPNVAAARELLIVKAKSGQLADVMRQEIPAETLAPSHQRGDIMDLVMEMALDLGPEIYVQQSRATQRRPDQQKTLRVLRIPSLVMGGVLDELAPVRRHEFMATLIPHANLEIVSDAGHLAPLEQPAETNRLLQAWLDQPFVLR